MYANRIEDSAPLFLLISGSHALVFNRVFTGFQPDIDRASSGFQSEDCQMFFQCVIIYKPVAC